MGSKFYVGIDVGTGSARAGVFDAAGRLVGTGRRDIRIWQEPGDIAEQSSEDIWAAVCASVRAARAEAGVSAEDITGIGFDATCSLVVVGPDGAPLSVGTGDSARNIIVWMDHRATEQARRINATRHPVLDYVGGSISPEMETPKLLWLREHRREAFNAAAHFFDLADYLTWRSTGSLARSSCTVTCKWTYLAHESRWDESYFRSIGLGVLADAGFARIGTEIVAPGTPLATGLTARAAAELGLAVGTPVGAGLIDAHAGGVGTIGGQGGIGTSTSRLAYVMGTSACTMASCRAAAYVPGVWGPYFNAMLPGLWLNEGGQSAAGAAIDQLLRHHPGFPEAEREADDAGVSVVSWLSHRVQTSVESLSASIDAAHGLHVVPDFLGNRSPLAEPRARALIAGLDMRRDIDSLGALYVAGVAALGYGLRQIIDAQRPHGVACETIVVSGGAGQSPLVRQLLADSTGVPVSVPESNEPVLLGSAMLGAVASGEHANLEAAMQQMSRIGTTVQPTPQYLSTHAGRYRGFLLLQQAGASLRHHDEDSA